MLVNILGKIIGQAKKNIFNTTQSKTSDKLVNTKTFSYENNDKNITIILNITQ